MWGQVDLRYLSLLPAALPMNPTLLRTAFRRTFGKFRDVSVEGPILSVETKESYMHIATHTQAYTHMQSHTHLQAVFL